MSYFATISRPQTNLSANGSVMDESDLTLCEKAPLWLEKAPL